jgi:hypothetical protein
MEFGKYFLDAKSANLVIDSQKALQNDQNLCHLQGLTYGTECSTPTDSERFRVPEPFKTYRAKSTTKTTSGHFWHCQRRFNCFGSAFSNAGCHQYTRAKNPSEVHAKLTVFNG